MTVTFSNIACDDVNDKNAALDVVIDDAVILDAASVLVNIELLQNELLVILHAVNVRRNAFDDVKFDRLKTVKVALLALKDLYSRLLITAMSAINVFAVTFDPFKLKFSLLIALCWIAISEFMLAFGDVRKFKTAFDAAR